MENHFITETLVHVALEKHIIRGKVDLVVVIHLTITTHTYVAMK